MKIIALAFGFYFLLLPATHAQSESGNLDSLLDVVHSLPRGRHQVDILGEIAYQYRFFNPDQSIYYAKETLNGAREIGYTAKEIFALNFLGLVKSNKGNYEEATDWLLQALEIAMEESDTSYLAKIYNNLGMIFWYLEDLEEAQRNYKNALQFNKSLELNLGMGENYVNLGVIYAAQSQLDSALLFYHKALPLFLEINYEVGVGTIYNNIARIHERKGNLEESLFFLEKALAILEDKGYVLHALPTYNNIGRIQTLMGEYGKAEKSLLLSLEKSQSQTALNEQMQAFKALHLLYDTINNTSKSLFYLKKFIALKDSIYNKEKTKQITQLKATFEEEQERKIVEKDKELQRNRLMQSIILFIGILILLSSASIIIFLYFKRNTVKKALYEEEKNRLETQQELEKLKFEKLETELSLKNQELTATTINIVQKNDVLKKLGKHLEELKSLLTNERQHKKMNKLIRLIENGRRQDEDWENFKLHFENVHPSFFEQLMQMEPSLSSKELRLCAYLRMNLTTKEIASLLGYSIRGVETARYRVRKKLNLAKAEDLNIFMMSIESVNSNGLGKV